jgi:hypothetical protein
MDGLLLCYYRIATIGLLSNNTAFPNDLFVSLFSLSLLFIDSFHLLLDTLAFIPSSIAHFILDSSPFIISKRACTYDCHTKLQWTDMCRSATKITTV